MLVIINSIYSDFEVYVKTLDCPCHSSHAELCAFERRHIILIPFGKNEPRWPGPAQLQNCL